MLEEETKKVDTDVVLSPAPAAPVPEPEVCKDETEEKYVVIEEKSVEETVKPLAAHETKKSGRFFRSWSKGKKKDAATKTETQTPDPAAVAEPAAIAEPEALVVEAPKEDIEDKLVVPATDTEEKLEDTTTPAVADAKKSAHFFKLTSLSSWKKSHKKTETVETPDVPEAGPEPPVVVEAPKDEIVEKSVIAPANEEKTEDSKLNVEADVADTKKSGGFFRMASIKWPKTKKKEEHSEVAEPLKVDADEKSIVPVEEDKVDDSKPVVVDDAKKGGKFFNLSSISWKKKETKESSEETIEEEEKINKASNRDTECIIAADEKTLALIQAWEESEKAKIENKAEKRLSVIVYAENSKKAAVEAELKKMEEKLETTKAVMEKLKNKEASIHRDAEEKRATVEAIRDEELLTAEVTAEMYRTTGSAPKKPLLGYF